jgi:hypothetical protein
MYAIRARVMHYYRENGSLPADLTNLPVVGDYDSRITDTWGNVVDYTSSTNDIVTLSSLGRDQRIGGVEEDADIECSFSAKDGAWIRVPKGNEDPKSGCVRSQAF